MAILSLGWSVDLVRSPAPDEAAPPSLPVSAPADQALSVPAIDVPASATTPRRATRRPGAQVASFRSTAGIPTDALVAYQRAEAVMNNADPDCNLSWPLLAAIGRVESNHGAGRGRIIGPRLDGAGPFARILDTDAGELDGDRVFDRAVGPMQFLPGTWAMVGVDADADGRRDPQDIDDAALAAAVHLCSGTEDLATPEGRAAAAHRYNHSDAYVALVLSLYDDYAAAPPILAMPVLSSIETVTASGPRSQGGRPAGQAAELPQPVPPPVTPVDPAAESVFDPPAPPVEPPTEEPSGEPSDPSTEPPAEPTDAPAEPPAGQPDACAPVEGATGSTGSGEPSEPTEPSLPAEPDPCAPAEEPTSTPADGTTDVPVESGTTEPALP